MIEISKHEEEQEEEQNKHKQAHKSSNLSVTMNSYAVYTYNKTKSQFAKDNLTRIAISCIVSCCSNLIKFLIYSPFVFNGPIKSLTTDRLLAPLTHYSCMCLLDPCTKFCECSNSRDS